MTDAGTPQTKDRALEAAIDESGPWAGWASGLGPALGLAVLMGCTVPLQHGWLTACGAVVVGWMLTWWRVRAVRRTVGRPLRALGPLARWVLLGTVIAAASVFLALGARAIAALTIAFPGSLWAGPVLVAGAVAATALRRSRRWLGIVVVLVALSVPVAGVLGTRFEQGAVDARGWAHSGPIHGIHPMQTTAVIVDGYGPFDLPLNDYVEPDGSRGYGPHELAQALSQALHRIGEVHFAQGPLRAKMAFDQAAVESVVTGPVYERLDREPTIEESQRFVVRSGTFGQRSRVEFVCPGRRSDPRGGTTSVMNRNCPTKYALESTAGLSVTGRWPGYAEGRGNERLGWSKLFSVTRSDDPSGRNAVADEMRVVAWLMVVVLAVWAGGRRPIWPGQVARAVPGLGGAALLVGVVLVLLGAWGSRDAALSVPVWLSASSVNKVPDPRGWLGIAVLVGAVPWIYVVGLSAGGGRGVVAGRTSPSARDWWTGLPFAWVGIVTLLVAARLSALTWITPDLADRTADGLMLEPFIMQVADVVGQPFGWTILETEGAMASVGVAGAMGLCIACVGWVREAASSVSASWGTPQKVWALHWGSMAAAAGLALAFIVSRKTLGGSTLVYGATGLTLVLSSLIVARATAHRGTTTLLARVLHLAWASAAIGLVWCGVDLAPYPSHWFVVASAAVGVIATVATVWAAFSRST